MASLAELLRRFRSQGVPGAPASAGVPVDRAAALAAELLPVLGALRDTGSRAAQLEDSAALRASERRTASDEEARRLLADARRRAPAERVEAATERLRRAADEQRALLAGAQVEADRIAAVAARRSGALVEDVVRRALAVGGPTAGPPTGPPATRGRR